MLKIENLSAGYGYLQVVWDVSFNVQAGEVVAIIGPNGSGKTTTLKSIVGIVPPKAGTIQFKGLSATNMPTHQYTRLGLSFIPEERNLFPAMKVEDNLLMGAYTIKEKARIHRNLEHVFELFPRLRERRRQLAGTMSGGERQMLAIARGLMSNPSMIILDEPSMGLSPENVVVVFDTIGRLRAENVTVLIVEQNVDTTLKFADRAYVMEQGRIVMEDISSRLLCNDYVRKVYLGVAD